MGESEWHCEVGKSTTYSILKVLSQNHKGQDLAGASLTKPSGVTYREQRARITGGPGFYSHRFSNCLTLWPLWFPILKIGIKTLSCQLYRNFGGLNYTRKGKWWLEGNGKEIFSLPSHMKNVVPCVLSAKNILKNSNKNTFGLQVIECFIHTMSLISFQEPCEAEIIFPIAHKATEAQPAQINCPVS